MAGHPQGLDLFPPSLPFTASRIRRCDGGGPTLRAGDSSLHPSTVKLLAFEFHGISFKTRPEAEVVLRVRDNGPGIPAELRQRIFDPFYTTKPVGSGTGLGLSIVQGIVQRHQGRVEVEVGEGGGVTFAVYLPTLEKRRQTEGGA